MGTILLIAVLAALGGFLGYVATKPDRFRIERGVLINAPPDRIYPLIADFRAWTGWSPWEKRDPNLRRRYSGPSAGKGAIYGWEGDRKVGAGEMEIIDAEPNRRLKLRLDFLRPFKASNVTDFTLTQTAIGTQVQWAMSGPSPFLSKLMGAVMDIDKMVGGDFEKGLASLKALAERPELTTG